MSWLKPSETGGVLPQVPLVEGQMNMLNYLVSLSEKSPGGEMGIVLLPQQWSRTMHGKKESQVHPSVFLFFYVLSQFSSLFPDASEYKERYDRFEHI